MSAILAKSSKFNDFSPLIGYCLNKGITFPETSENLETTNLT